MTSEKTVNVPNGYKKTELGIIPNEWNVVKLGDYADITKLAGFEYTDYFNGYQDTGEIIVVRGTNIKNNVLDLSDVKTIPKSVSNQLQRSKLSKNDLVFAYVGTIGPVAIIDENEKYHLGPNTCRITSDECTIHHKFLYTYFASYLIQKEIDKHTSVSAQPSLSMTKIRSFRIIAPPLPEQHKIASILSKVDEHISHTEAIIEKTEELKKGLMQQLLTKGIGHTKFKKTEIGEIPEEWDVKEISDVCLINLGSLKPSTDPEYELNYIDIASIEKTGCKPIRTKVLFKEAPSRARRIVKGNNILVSTVRPNLRGFTYIDDAEDNLICSTGFAVLESKNSNVPRYIYQFILSNLFLNQIIPKLVGSNYPAINTNDLSIVKIPVPPFLEQQKIASILSKVDDQLSQNQTYLSHLQELKKGLMQDLLTGKVRVTV